MLHVVAEPSATTCIIVRAFGWWWEIYVHGVLFAYQVVYFSF